MLVARLAAIAAMRGANGLRAAVGEYPPHALALSLALGIAANRWMRFAYFAAFQCVLLAPCLRHLLDGLRRIRFIALVGRPVLFVMLLLVVCQSRITSIYGTWSRAI